MTICTKCAIVYAPAGDARSKAPRNIRLNVGCEPARAIHQQRRRRSRRQDHPGALGIELLKPSLSRKGDREEAVKRTKLRDLEPAHACYFGPREGIFIDVRHASWLTRASASPTSFRWAEVFRPSSIEKQSHGEPTSGELSVGPRDWHLGASNVFSLWSYEKPCGRGA